MNRLLAILLLLVLFASCARPYHNKKKFKRRYKSDPCWFGSSEINRIQTNNKIIFS